MSSSLRILLVDDEPTICLVIGDLLTAAGHAVTVIDDGTKALSALDSDGPFDLLITDMRLPGADGLTIYRHAREQSDETDFILITAFGEVDAAVTALKEGAYDYITKPFDNDELLLRVNRLAQQRALRQELRAARDSLAADSRNTIVGNSAPMLRLRERIETIAASDAAVIVTGESGTGKELVVRSLHRLSPRRDKRLVAVNCAAFPETLLEAELFGHIEGAYTGATRARQGRFGAADGGTIFLDEIADIPPMAQVKLLRVLESGVIEPLGSDTSVEVDVRVVSATHRNLKERIAAGLFREDLYYRLNVLDIVVPPLRARRDDLPLLAEFFLRRFAPAGLTTIGPAAWEMLVAHDFPGNVRELEHAVQHAVVLARGGEIAPRHLPAAISGAAASIVDAVTPATEPSETELRPLAEVSREFERDYLVRALNLTGGKKTRAAELLGISRKNLWEKVRGHGITDSDLDH